MKVLVIYGTRPELIKLFPVINELRITGIDTCVYSTRQHWSLLTQTENSLKVFPDHSMVMRFSHSSLNGLFSDILHHVAQEIENETPDVVIVQGDTTTAAASAIASFNCGVPVAHVEAGIRTYDLTQPRPEEAYRQIISRIASVHFCPTEQARMNLDYERVIMSENFSHGSYVVGNTEIDAVKHVLKSNRPRFNDGVVATIHRRESIGDSMRNICRNIVMISQNTPVIMTVHPNPGVADIINKELSGKKNIKLINPLPFTEFINLLSEARVVVTDSGGVQEDCSYLGIPTVVARNVTDRPEAVECGSSITAGVNGDSIYNIAERLLTNDKEWDIMAKAKCPYGDGTAAIKIVSILRNIYGKN